MSAWSSDVCSPDRLATRAGAGERPRRKRGPNSPQRPGARNGSRRRRTPTPQVQAEGPRTCRARRSLDWCFRPTGELLLFACPKRNNQEKRHPWLCAAATQQRSEEHTSELQSLMRISYAVFCLKKKNNKSHKKTNS